MAPAAQQDRRQFQSDQLTDQVTRMVRNIKLKHEITREEIARKQAASARGYDLQGEDNIGDEVMDMTPE